MFRDQREAPDANLAIDINKTDKYGRTPLSLATKNNHTEIIQLLKDAGAT